MIPPCQHVAVGVVGVGLAGSRVEGHGGGMHGVVVGKCRAALVGDVADGVVDVSTACLALVYAEGAGGGDETIQIIVSESAAGGKKRLRCLSQIIKLSMPGTITMPDSCNDEVQSSITVRDSPFVEKRLLQAE